MTEEELKEHRTLERAFLHSKERRNLYKKRIKAMQKIIDAQNEVIQRKDHYIKKCLEQIEKMKLDQKTAFDKGMKHLAKELKEYDRINGAWTDYFEHTVSKVLKWELEEIGKTERELEG